MTDQREKTNSGSKDNESVDPLSERLVVLVVAWIAIALLLPLHVLFAYNLFFTEPAFGLFALFLAFGLPLLVVDFFAFRWFKDNYLVFRWINRSDEAHKRRNGRR